MAMWLLFCMRMTFCAFSPFVFVRFFFFFNDTATTEIYTLSLHDALPISSAGGICFDELDAGFMIRKLPRSEEHTSELQSHVNLVCRLLLEKKKNTNHCDGSGIQTDKNDMKVRNNFLHNFHFGDSITINSSVPYHFNN